MIIETAIALILIFGALVMFHELGHFLTARAVGIRVEEFAFGFGPKLIRLFKRGDTEYTIHPFPLGGFVKLAGMEPGEENVPDGFQAQAAWKRALVIVSGPVASFILAALAFICLGVFWGFPTGDKSINRVAMVQPQTVAARIGLRAGDRIIGLNGKNITRGNFMTSFIHDSPGKTMHLVIKRNGETLRKTASPAYAITYGGINWTFYNPKEGKVDSPMQTEEMSKAGIKEDDILVSLNGMRITGGKQMIEVIKNIGEKRVDIVVKRGSELVHAHIKPYIQIVKFMDSDWYFPECLVAKNETRKTPNSTFSKSGFMALDRVISVNGRKIKSGSDLAAAISENKTAELVFKVERGKSTKTITIRPSAADLASLDAPIYDAIGLFGFQPEPVLRKTGFVESINMGVESTWRLVNLIIYSLAPSRVAKNVGGPLSIAMQTSSMVALGPYYVIQMGGMLSMSLFFVNLLPIPVLDGGHLLIIFLESIRRKRFSIEQMRFATAIGLLLIGIIMISVLWSDIYKYTKGLVPQ